MTAVDPLNDRLDIYSSQLGTVAECSPQTLLKYTLEAGSNIIITQNPDGTVTIASQASLIPGPKGDPGDPGPPGPPGTVPLTPGAVGSYVVTYNENADLTTGIYPGGGIIVYGAGGSPPWWIPGSSGNSGLAPGTWQAICAVMPGTGEAAGYYDLAQRIA